MRRPKFRKLALAAALALSLGACGYRLAGSRLGDGAGRTLAVPLFANRTTEFKIEQRLTDAVRRELIQRTGYRVTPVPGGDLLLVGEVLGVTSFPVIVTAGGRSAAYTVAVDVRVRLTEMFGGAVLFENDRWTFREVFELSDDSEEFVPEDPAAMDRLARQFASSLVAAIQHTGR